MDWWVRRMNREFSAVAPSVAALPRLAAILALVVLACLPAAGAPGYLAPGTPEVGGVRHLVLVYHGMKRRPLWNAENLLPYVAYVDEAGRPKDWLFDSFLFIEFSTDGDAWLHHYREGKPQPALADWQWLADSPFRETAGLAGLDAAVAKAGEALGDPGRRVKVVLTLPAPPAKERAFGPLPGEDGTLDFSREGDRQRALRWYLDEVVRQWRARTYRHVELAGFYWLAEAIPQADADLVRWTAAAVRERGFRLTWIPYHGAQGLRQWRERGIDAVMMQPNYFFRPGADAAMLMQAARLSRAYGAGVEMEFDARALADEDFRSRFWAYLDAGVKYGWMKEALLGYYEGGGALLEFLKKPEQGRELYDALYRFVKGTYQPSGKTALPDLPVIARDTKANLALAAKGARIHGCVRLKEHPDLVPEKIIDGEADLYGGMDGFGYIAWPGSFTVELPEVATVARTQVLLFELDSRWFRYRIETSVDGQTWQPAVDKSEGQWRGWQVDRFAPRPAKHVRFTGIHNSANGLFQVVEMEVYPTAE